MSRFLDLAKEGVDAYMRSQSDVKKTGGEEYNTDHNQGRVSGGPAIDQEYAVKKASEHGSGEKSLFESALGFLQSNSSEHDKPVDEDEVQKAHDKAYKQGDTSGLSSQLLGSAAALQAFKKFTGGEKKEEKQGGNTQSQLISMAMAEASKLFDKSGGSASGNKQDAVNGAAMTVMKLLIQSKFSGTTGGKESGGISQLLSLLK